MKKFLIVLLVLALLAGTAYYFREPILDMLPIDRSGWVEENGSRYLLDEAGNPRTGWLIVDNNTYFFREDGAMHTGWLEEDSSRFYFEETGVMATGWAKVEGENRCFGNDGKLVTGLLEENDCRWLLDENGIPQEGFFPLDDFLTCYIAKDGRIPSGWLELAEGKYFLNRFGCIQTGWLYLGEDVHYLDETDGHMVTGWLEKDGCVYYLYEEDGTLATGTVEIDGEEYYFGENGLAQRGWVELNGKTYYYGENGAPYSGWLEEDGKRYYLREDGSVTVGRLEIDGQMHFFTSTGVNFIMVNPWNPLPEDFEPNLVEIDYGHQIDPVCQEALEQMLADCRAAGFSPTIVSSYRTIEKQKANLQRMINSYLDDGYSYDEAYRRSVQIVAVPGTSEHHLGLALDIVDSGYTKLNHDQAKRPTQKWLMENSWKYGFIIRYPEGSTEITGIIYEPWHYRYVGLELAKEIHDLGNITLEEYIDNLTNDGTTCGGKQPQE